MVFIRCFRWSGCGRFVSSIHVQMVYGANSLIYSSLDAVNLVILFLLFMFQQPICYTSTDSYL
jgi:hypothetical protein